MMIVVEVPKELGEARSISLGLSIIRFILSVPKGLADGFSRVRERLSRK